MAFNYTRVLKIGMSGQDVKDLQLSLQQLGYSPGTADGIFGSRTRAAVMAFQTDNRLVADGIVGPNTANALNQALGVGRVTYLKVGSKGPEVKQLQLDLTILGYQPGPADGIFGNRTREAVIAFQRDRGLAADGIVGPATSRALEMAVNRPRITEGIIATARSLIGYPYVWGGESPAEGGFDCSGLVYYVYRQYGIQVPRVSQDQYKTGVPVDRSQLQPGDLVFFDINSKGTVDHVGIYSGNGMFINASSSQGVIETYLSNPYWSQRYAGARRVY